MSIEYKGYIFPLRRHISLIGVCHNIESEELDLFCVNEINSGTTWTEHHCDELMRYVEQDKHLREIANILGRTPYATICKLQSLSLKSNRTKTMSNNNAINLTVTMNELVDSAIDDLKFYNVSFAAKPDNPAEELIDELSDFHTYKSMDDYEVGESVLVPYYAEHKIGVIVDVISQPANYSNIPKYKWILTNVSDVVDKIEKLEGYESQLAKQIKDVQRSSVRKSVMTQLLGADFKALPFKKTED